MTIDSVRDIIISICSVVFIGALIFFAVLAYSFYRRLDPLMTDLKATFASTRALSAYAEKELFKPLSQIAIIMQSVYQGMCIVSKFMNFANFQKKGESDDE